MACVHYRAGGSWVCTATGQCFTSLNLSVPICTVGTMTPISQRYGLISGNPFPLNCLMSLSFLRTQWA